MIHLVWGVAHCIRDTVVHNLQNNLDRNLPEALDHRDRSLRLRSLDVRDFLEANYNPYRHLEQLVLSDLVHDPWKS